MDNSKNIRKKLKYHRIRFKDRLRLYKSTGKFTLLMNFPVKELCHIGTYGNN